MTRPIETSQDLTLPFSSDPALQRRFLVVDEPLAGNIRFDLLLEVLDKLAEDTALAYARRSLPQARVVTAAIDNILLREPADVNRSLDLYARVNYVGTSSLEVGIRLEHPEPKPIHLASCYFTMVARLGEGQEVRSAILAPLEYGVGARSVNSSRITRNRSSTCSATESGVSLGISRDDRWIRYSETGAEVHC